MAKFFDTRSEKWKNSKWKIKNSKWKMKISKFRLHKALRNVENRTSKEAGRMKLYFSKCYDYLEMN